MSSDPAIDHGTCGCAAGVLPGVPPGPLLERVPGAAYIYDLASRRVAHANRRAAPLFAPSAAGAAAGDAPGDPVDLAARIHPDDLAAAEFHWARLRATADGECRELLCRMRRPDGTWRLLRFTESPFSRNGPGDARTAIGVVEDVTDFVRETVRAKRGEELFRFLHEIGDDDARDWQALIRRTLDEAVRLTGSEIGYLHFVHDDEANLELFCWSTGTPARCTAAPVRHCPLASAGVWADSVRLRRPVFHNDYEATPGRKGLPEGHAPLARHLGIPVIDAGKVVLAAGVGNKRDPYDADDARVLEFMFSEMWRIFRRREAEERMREGAERLREAERMETVARLAEGISHALNNLLTPVQGFAEMLLESIDPRHPHREPLESIRTASEGATRLVGQLLAFSGRRPLHRATVDPGPFLAAFALVAKQVVRGDIAVEFVAEGALPRTEIDRPQIEQVLHALVLNAADAMPDGGRVRIAARRGRIVAEQAERHGIAPGPCLEIELTDEGRRPDPETLARIFDPFGPQGLDEGRRALGMAAARGILRAHGGLIEASPGEPAGARFTLRLPAEAGEEAAPDAAPDAAGAKAPLARLLVVDDEPSVLRFLVDSLANAGYAVEGAGDAARVAESSDERLAAIDLLVTDVVMPALSGPDLVARLRARRPDLKALFITGYTDRDMGSFASGPLDGRLHKPFGFRDLRAAVAELLAADGVAPRA